MSDYDVMTADDARTAERLGVCGALAYYGGLAAALVGRTAGAVSTQRWLIAKGDPRALSKLGYDPNKQEN